MASTNPRRILLVEDDLPVARVYQAYLKNEPYQITHVASGKEALGAIKLEMPDAILLDLKLPDMSGHDILKQVRASTPTCPVIVITAHGSINVAVEAMQAGAADFMLKPFNADRLIYTLRNALEQAKLSRIVQTLSGDMERGDYCGFIGSSVAMQAVYHIIENAAPSTATVFVTGETGTGKELCAEAIHQKSARADKPFIALNCGAIPAALMESEIFGHVKGAFTGAVADREGIAQQANGGTLFLDEICEMDKALQVKLLRFIQTGTIQKVGGSATEEVDVRFVCATNKDPWAEVVAGNFREDLYYRLHVIPIHLPPLRQRGEDVGELSQHFLELYNQQEGKRFSELTQDAQDSLRACAWFGNVRQLQNAIHQAVILHNGTELSADMLPSLSTDEHDMARWQNGQESGVQQSPDSTAPMVIRPMWQVEREMVMAAMVQCGNNVPRAATMLDLSPSTIYRRMREVAKERARAG